MEYEIWFMYVHFARKCVRWNKMANNSLTLKWKPSFFSAGGTMPQCHKLKYYSAYINNCVDNPLRAAACRKVHALCIVHSAEFRQRSWVVKWWVKPKSPFSFWKRLGLTKYLGHILCCIISLLSKRSLLLLVENASSIAVVFYWLSTLAQARVT